MFLLNQQGLYPNFVGIPMIHHFAKYIPDYGIIDS